jgi:hypothetical protein
MNTSRRRSTVVGLVILLLIPAICWGQGAAEMRRGQIELPTNTGISKLVFSPDGKLLAVGSLQDATISICDVAAVKEKLRLQLPRKNYGYEMVFSADCRTLVVSGREDAMFRTFDVVTGKQLREVHRPTAQFLAFAPGGKRAVCYDYRAAAVEVCDVETARIVWKSDNLHLGPRMMGVNAAAFSSDGKLLALHGGNGEVELWNADNGRTVRVLRANPNGGGGAFKFIVFSPDSKLVAGGGHTDDSLHVWAVATGKERLRMKAKQQYGYAVAAAFSADGTWMAHASMDGFFLYDLREGKGLLPLEGMGGIFSPDGATLAVPTQKTSPNNERSAAITLYDIPVRRQDALPRQLDGETLALLWQDLTADDDFRLQRVFASLRAAPADATTFLVKKLQPASAAELKVVKGLLIDLDDDEPKTREKAMAQLQELTATFEPLLMRVARENASGEVRNRVKFVLGQQREKAVPRALLVQLRAIQVLEQIGSAGARQTLEELAGGAAGARVTEEARQALARLGAGKE